MALSSQLTFMTAAEVKQQIIEDLTLQYQSAGYSNPPVEPNGEWDLLATTTGNVASVLIANQQQLDEDSDPTRAGDDALEDYRKWLQLPELPASAASGQLTVTVIGTGSILSGLGFVAPNGATGTIISGKSDVSGDVTVDAVASSTGPVGNLTAGMQVRLVGAPPNLQTVAVVTSDWTGGTDTESTKHKRERILSRLRSSNAGWGALRDAVLSHTNAISDAYVYWALGGPGATKIVVVSGTTATTRQVSDSTVNEIWHYLETKYPVGTWKLKVQSAIDSPVDVEISLGLPSTGANRWLASGPTTRTIVTAANSETDFYVTSATTLGALSVGETIACWDPVALTAATARVTAISSTSISTTVWSGGDGPKLGSWIFPACDGLQTIVDKWLEIMLSLGPGENVLPADGRYRFSRRLPIQSANYPANISSVQLLKLQQAIPEATDVFFTSAGVTCPTPPLASDAPYVLCQNNFAIYPIAS